jgi:hypothetical protein
MTRIQIVGRTLGDFNVVSDLLDLQCEEPGGLSSNSRCDFHWTSI